MFLAFAHSYLFLCTECLVQRLRAGFYPNEWRLKEYSILQENPYTVRYIHTVLVVHIYFAPWGVDNV